MIFTHTFIYPVRGGHKARKIGLSGHKAKKLDRAELIRFVDFDYLVFRLVFSIDFLRVISGSSLGLKISVFRLTIMKICLF